MSDFVLWFCERGYCKKAVQQPTSPLAQEGGLALAADSAPLGPLPHRKTMTLPPSDGAAKFGLGRPLRGSKGPSTMSLKEFPVTEDFVVPRKAFNTLPKSAGGVKGRLFLLEDGPGGKSTQALEVLPRGLGARVALPASSQDKQLARISRSPPREPLPAFHGKARGDSPGAADKVPPGPYKTGYVMLRRSKKAPRQARPLKGPPPAAPDGTMEVKRKPALRTSDPRPINLAGLQHGDLIEIFRFGYQHWAIYVGDGYVIHLAPPSEFAGAGCASLMSTLTDKALVKKELLEVVVGKNRFRVNNKHDIKYPTLPIPKIVRRAEEMVGQELEYKVTSENCEHFVTELRPGLLRVKGDRKPSLPPQCASSQLPSSCILSSAAKTPAGLSTRFLDMQKNAAQCLPPRQGEPKPGDLIEIFRSGYQHWAIYVGAGYVVHLAPSDDLGLAVTSSLMSVVTEKAVVRKELLWNITEDGDYRVNNKYDLKYPPFPASKIVREAEALLGREMPYSVTSGNCEHFVTRLRYGIARSDQVRDLVVAGTVGLVGVGVVAAVASLITSLILPSRREEK
ncbi:hypothetical protein lerEdw1_015243 [Lerista edwardsae]|nr:hypothetical protein lerEdw1_015243 [Lerista edwardsae]